MLEINLLDVGVVIVLLLFFARGLMRGLMSEVGGLVAIVGGCALARHFQPSVQPALTKIFASADIAAFASFGLIFLLVGVLVLTLTAALRKFMSITMTSWIDHALGGLTGVAKGLLLLCLLFFLAQGFFPNLTLVKNAQATPLFNSLADYLRNFLPIAFTAKLPIFRL
ncbi:MAG: CvpA family protein [Deltaproteobacteria bacterium]|jgi:membrane protein required for colicin V production|nr:CvpA family protein [Deltaproteobacteria bacterium]